MVGVSWPFSFIAEFLLVFALLEELLAMMGGLYSKVFYCWFASLLGIIFFQPETSFPTEPPFKKLPKPLQTKHVSR